MHRAWRGCATAVAAAATATLLGCSDGETPTATPVADSSETEAPVPNSPAGNLPPVIDWVRLSPQEVNPGELLTATVQAHDPEGKEVKVGYSWQFGSHRLSGGEASIHVPTTAKRGDVLRVSVVASDSLTTSKPSHATAEVGNTAPEWRELSLEHPERITPGSKLTIVAGADDHDGDELLFETIWYVNDREHESRGTVFDTSELKRGDSVFAVVLAADKTLTTEERETDKLKIGNSDPTIVSAPGSLSKDAKFDYQLEVTDPDGDRRFRFQLVSAPSGMTIDDSFGKIIWQATEEHKGTHAVEILATDLYGGEARQQFELTVKVRTEETSPAAPASDDSEDLNDN